MPGRGPSRPRPDALLPAEISTRAGCGHPQAGIVWAAAPPLAVINEATAARQSAECWSWRWSSFAGLVFDDPAVRNRFTDWEQTARTGGQCSGTLT
jgi:hypothetical protein